MTQSSTHPLVSVVIPHYGGMDILGECLTSLNKCIYPNIEIIVKDHDLIIHSESSSPQVFYVINEIQIGPTIFDERHSHNYDRCEGNQTPKNQ